MFMKHETLKCLRNGGLLCCNNFYCSNVFHLVPPTKKRLNKCHSAWKTGNTRKKHICFLRGSDINNSILSANEHVRRLREELFGTIKK